MKGMRGNGGKKGKFCKFGWRTEHAPYTARKDGQGTPCPYILLQSAEDF